MSSALRSNDSRRESFFSSDLSTQFIIDKRQAGTCLSSGNHKSAEVVSKVGIFFLSEVSTFQLRSTEKGISTRVGDVGGRSSSRTSFTMSPAVAARRLEKSLSWSEIPADFLH